MQPPRNRLWAPWRLAYIKVARAKGCFFCVYARNQKRDAKNHVVSRGRHAFCVINRFPYNNGHLMVAPLRHTGKLESLTPEEVLGIWELTADAKRRLDRSMRPHGYNIGINIGRPAGAGVPGHVHLHIVPRWGGDTNYMPVVGNTKVLPMSLQELFKLLTR